MKEFFEGEVIADALKAGNPFVKADLLTWLAEKLPNGMIVFVYLKKKMLSFADVLHFIYSQCESTK